MGGRNDFAADVSGHLLSVEGSFDSVSGVTSLVGQAQGSGPDVADTYSLQLNTRPFVTPACSGSPNADCRGWQQFLYSSTSGSIFIQYWLLRYNTTCPAGFNSFSFPSSSDIYCFRNGPSSTLVGRQPASNLINLKLVGAANVAGNDVVTMSTGGTMASAANPAGMLDLASAWTGAEFILVGDCCSTEARFNPGATIVVRTTVHNGTRMAPTCTLTGFTGETNNLNLIGTPPISPAGAPSIVSRQSNVPGTAPSCATAAGTGDPHLTTFSGLLYDFQATGDFVLAEAGKNFTVQSRQVSGAPLWPNAAVNAAVGARFGKTTVSVCLGGLVEVDGKPVSLTDGKPLRLANGADVLRQGDLYLLRGPNGDSVSARVNAGWIDVTVGLGSWPRDVRGLLANPKNDVDLLETREGKVLHEPVSFESFYKDYGDSWRVQAGESFLCGKESERGNPTRSLYTKDLDQDLAKQSLTTCRRAGVPEGPLLDACTLDVSVIGKPSAAKAYVDMQPPIAVHTH